MQYRLRLSSLTNRVANVALGLVVTATAVTSASKASAQAFPFPSSNTQATNGRFVTPVLTTYELKAQYARWQQLFLDKTCANNQIRVKYPESGPPDVVNDTRSEGIGYGMIIAAYMGDQTTFQGLRNFYFGHTAGTGLMDWKWNNCTARGNNGQGSAADADVDAAMALIVASKQWPGMGFDTDANTLLNAIRTNLFDAQCAGILLAGTTFKSCGCINASYIPVGYYPAYAAAQAAQAQTWNTARTNSYTYYNAVNDNTTGLLPAWSSSNNPQTGGGCNPEVGGGGAANQFQADAARTPWRVSVDYAWTANPSAQTFLRSIANFAKTQPIVNIVDLYNLNGAPQKGVMNGTVNADTFRSTFVMGGFATAMTASSQEDLNAFTGAWQSLYLRGDTLPTAHAFNSSLALLYGLLVTGTMWDPNGSPPTKVMELPLQPQGANLVVNGDFDEGVQGWITEVFGTPPSQGYAMHLGGEVHLRTQVNDPAKPYNLKFSQSLAMQANQNYLLTMRARSAAPRPIRLLVALNADPYTTYGQLVNRYSATDPVTLTADMTTYETVFHATVADPAAQLAVQFGDSSAEVIIDDITLTPTDRPVTVPGELSGQPPPTTVDPTTDTTPPGGATPPGGPGQVIPNQGDIGSTPNGALGPSGSANGGINGATPPIPMGTVNGNGTCKADADCTGTAITKCSQHLWLCYDPATGYVASPTSPGGWSAPPQYFDKDGDGNRDDDCGLHHVWWELVGNGVGACYDPASGLAFNENSGKWQFVGANYQMGLAASGGGAASGCSVSSAVGDGPAQQRWPLALGAALGAALTLGYRRRARAAR